MAFPKKISTFLDGFPLYPNALPQKRKLLFLLSCRCLCDHCTRSSYSFNCRGSRGSLRKAQFIGLGRTCIFGDPREYPLKQAQN